MRHDNAGSTVGDGVGEDLARVHQAGRQGADGHHPLGNQTMSTVQCQADKVFLLFVANVGQPYSTICIYAASSVPQTTTAFPEPT